MTLTYDYLIVGAGLTGAALAHELTKQGHKVLVVDRRSTIAGNIYTEKQSDIILHKYGAHIFHTNKDWVWEYVNNFVEFIPYKHSVIARYKDKEYNLPFNLNTINQVYNLDSVEDNLKAFNKDLILYKNIEPTNLEEQALKLIGKPIYETLIKGYTEKQWGKDCKELSPDIIKRLPVRNNYDNNYFNDKYQGIPKGGYTNLIAKLLEGIEIKLNFDYNLHKNEIKANKILHTGMIDEYYNYCFGDLEYRSLKFETTCLPYSQLQSVAVINYTEKEIPWTRIIEHNHFEPSSTRWTLVTKEYPIKYTKGQEAYYPINTVRNNELYLKYREKADQEGIIFCGRLGAYQYLDMDKAIEKAFELLEILKKS